ncbi:MAG: hypothetical protein QOI12_242 [Alphaproteobacteria bacterium]|jgi:hypothetical protein|nr:hypothetical protein [Alphaproteobacteria bacterium]
MLRGVRCYLVGVLGLLGLLAACSGGKFFVERESWRHEAEVTCLNSGAVKESAGKVRIKPINGPGMCGADFPIKVSALGDAAPLGYSDELRPPSAIPPGAQPRWPAGEPRGAAPSTQRTDAPARYDPPLSLDPPGVAAPAAAASEPYDFRRPYGAAPRPATTPARRAPVLGAPLDPNSPAYDMSPEPYERRRVIEEPTSRPPGRTLPEPRRLPIREAQPAAVPALPPLGPARDPQATGAFASVSVSPAATLACPLVSVLDQWIAGSVQPAAMRWFGQPVVEIRQISAYSCRGMNGNPNARISEHAFGNALDIASFTLADGRKVVVKTGWSGAPEEQGFLRDVQGAACDAFNTVLAPGSNVYHYDHIHVDLMRRNGGRRACNPRAVSGEEIAARARARYAAKHGGEPPSVTGSVSPRRPAAPLKPSAQLQRLPATAYSEDRSRRDLPAAVPGDDGEE